MPSTKTILTGLLASTAALAKNATSSVPNTVPSLWDGECFYPTPDIGFDTKSYLGRWYQVAGTVAPFTASCKCIYAQYALNVGFFFFLFFFLFNSPYQNLGLATSSVLTSSPGQRHNPG